jgi:antitoxin ParD1/3/4
MNIPLPKRHAEWLEAQVADGSFPSVEEAVAQIIEDRIEFETDDLAWASDAIAVARRDIAERRTISLEEHQARNAARLARIGG